MDTSQGDIERSGFDTRQIPTATDFELPDYWDEGEPLAGRELWPVCITLNIVSVLFRSNSPFLMVILSILLSIFWTRRH